VERGEIERITLDWYLDVNGFEYDELDVDMMFSDLDYINDSVDRETWVDDDEVISYHSDRRSVAGYDTEALADGEGRLLSASPVQLMIKAGLDFRIVHEFNFVGPHYYPFALTLSTWTRSLPLSLAVVKAALMLGKAKITFVKHDSESNHLYLEYLTACKPPTLERTQLSYVAESRVNPPLDDNPSVKISPINSTVSIFKEKNKKNKKNLPAKVTNSKSQDLPAVPPRIPSLGYNVKAVSPEANPRPFLIIPKGLYKPDYTVVYGANVPPMEVPVLKPGNVRTEMAPITARKAPPHSFAGMVSAFSFPEHSSLSPAPKPVIPTPQPNPNIIDVVPLAASAAEAQPVVLQEEVHALFVNEAGMGAKKKKSKKGVIVLSPRYKKKYAQWRLANNVKVGTSATKMAFLASLSPKKVISEARMPNVVNIPIPVDKHMIGVSSIEMPLAEAGSKLQFTVQGSAFSVNNAIYVAFPKHWLRGCVPGAKVWFLSAGSKVCLDPTKIEWLSPSPDSDLAVTRCPQLLGLASAYSLESDAYFSSWTESQVCLYRLDPTSVTGASCSASNVHSPFGSKTMYKCNSVLGNCGASVVSATNRLVGIHVGTTGSANVFYAITTEVVNSLKKEDFQW
jgi:hypothetical protein